LTPRRVGNRITPRVFFAAAEVSPGRLQSFRPGPAAGPVEVPVMSVKESLSDLLDVLSEPSLSEPVRSVWAVVTDELDNLPTPLPDSAAQACRDALRPADGLGRPAQWTGRDWAKAVAALACWSRCRGLNGLGKSWIAKAGGAAPDNHEAGTRELAGLLYRRLLDAVGPRGSADRLSGRQRALMLATTAITARELDVSLMEKVEQKRSLEETPEAYVADLIRRGLLEKGGPGAASVVNNWPGLLEDRSKFRDSFWSELRELVEPPGKAVLPLTAAGIALVVLLIAALLAWGKSSKMRDELETVGKAVREAAKDSLKSNPDPTAEDLARAVTDTVGKQAKELKQKSAELKTLSADLRKAQDQLAEKSDSLNAAAAVRKDLEANLDAARKQRDAAKTEVEKLTAAVKAATDRVADRDKTVQATKAELDRTTGEREKLVVEVKGLRDELGKGRTDAKALQAKLDAADAALARSKTDLAKKQDELKRADAQLVNANEALKATTVRLAGVEKNLNSAKADLKDAQSRLKASDEAAAKVGTERDKARAELEKTRTELTGAVAKLTAADKSIKTVQGERDKALTDLAGAKDRLAAAERDVASAKAGGAKADAELAKVRVDLESARKDLAGLRTENAGLKKANTGLSTEVAGLKKDNAELRKENAELKNRKDVKDPKDVGKTEDPPKTKETPKTKDTPAGSGGSVSPRGGDAPKIEFAGVLLRNLSEADRAALNLAPAVKGVLVHEVKAGTKAAAAGLKADDVILELRADFLVGNMVLSQEAKVSEAADAAAIAGRVAALKRDNKFKCWHVRLTGRTVVIEE
jgi:predicted  nucleic acid-binding Zn-ribbon protein